MTRVLISLLLTLVVSSSSLAQQASAPPPRVEQQIVVTASSIPEETAMTPAAVTVITAAMIEQQKARDVAELLRQVPGLVLSRSGSGGKATSLFTRGSNSTHTLVLWNGIEINNPYFSGYDWGRFSTAGVERVEIVRGPFSALYGSDAVAGVINILTDSKRAPFLALDIHAGQKGLMGGNLSGSMQRGAWGASASLETREDDGWNPNDDFAQDSALARLDWTGATGSIGLQARYTSYDTGIPFNVDATGSVLVPSLLRRQEGSELQLAIPLRLQRGGLTYDLTVSRIARNDDFADPEDSFGLVTASTDSLVDRAHLSVRIPSAIGTWVAGAEYEHAVVDDVSSYGTALENERRDSRAFFLEDRLSKTFAGGSHLELSLGVRSDDFDTFGSEVSPRIAGAWIVGREKFRAAYGEAFRAPSVGELYFPFSGNRELDAERSETAEVGFDHFLASRGMFSVTLFASDYKDLIVFDNAAFRFENVGEASVHGAELAASRHFEGGFSSAISYTYLDTEQAGTGETLLRRPRHSGSASLAYERGEFRVSAVVLHGGSRADILAVFPYSRITNEAYTTMDLAAGYRWGSLEPYIKVENLTDEAYQEVFGFDSPGRRAMVGIRYAMR